MLSQYSGPTLVAEVAATEMLAGFAAGLRFDELPSEVARQAKQSILDTLGVAFAGAAIGEGCGPIADYAVVAGGSGGSSIWSSGVRLAPAQAALVNAAHARALDYDDIILFPQIHVAACVVPAVLAVAQSRSPRRVTGRDLVAAGAAGGER